MPRRTRCLVLLTAVTFLASIPLAWGAAAAGKITSVKELQQVVLDIYRAAFERELAQTEKMLALGRAGIESRELWRQMRTEREEARWLGEDLRRVKEMVKGMGEMVLFERWFENEVVQTPHLASEGIVDGFEERLAGVGQALRAHAAAMAADDRGAVAKTGQELGDVTDEFRFFCEKLGREVRWKMWRAEWEGHKETDGVAEKLKLFDEKRAAYEEAEAKLIEQRGVSQGAQALLDRYGRELEQLREETGALADEVNELVGMGGYRGERGGRGGQRGRGGRRGGGERRD